MTEVSCASCKCQGGHFSGEEWVPCLLCEGVGIVSEEANEAFLRASVEDVSEEASRRQRVRTLLEGMKKGGRQKRSFV